MTRPIRGSSPLARGLPHIEVDSPKDIGIIPARAGFTQAPRKSAYPQEDHPRSRGVYRERVIYFALALGSSPLARGLLIIGRSVIPNRGIIPARAGFTEPSDLLDELVQDHPRSRGVYAVRERTQEGEEGSSPLARGLQLGPVARRLRERIIPARAGFTHM